MDNRELVEQSVQQILAGEDVDAVVTDITERMGVFTKVIGGVGAAFSITAVYDWIRSRKRKETSDELVEIMTKGALVNSKQFIKKIDKTIKVMTSTEEIRKGLMREKKLSIDEINAMAEYIGPSLRRGDNAAAFPGNEAMYIMAPPRAHADVLAHEIGHILDFRERNVTFSNMERKGFFHRIFKNKYMRDERVAWDKAPGGGTKDRSKLRKLALLTYEKYFHLRRSKFNGAMAGLSLLAFLSVFFGHDLKTGRQSR